MNAEEFIKKYRRNYINYAALVEVTLGGGKAMQDEYQKLSSKDKQEVVRRSAEVICYYFKEGKNE